LKLSSILLQYNYTNTSFWDETLQTSKLRRNNRLFPLVKNRKNKIKNRHENKIYVNTEHRIKEYKWNGARNCTKIQRTTKRGTYVTKSFTEKGISKKKEKERETIFYQWVERTTEGRKLVYWGVSTLPCGRWIQHFPCFNKNFLGVYGCVGFVCVCVCLCLIVEWERKKRRSSLLFSWPKRHHRGQTGELWKNPRTR